MKKQIYDEKNGLSYTLYGDYYFPDLEINEEEAVAIRTIFDQYVNTDLGANGIAKYFSNINKDYLTRIEPGFKVFAIILKTISSDYFFLQYISDF